VGRGIAEFEQGAAGDAVAERAKSAAHLAFSATASRAGRHGALAPREAMAPRGEMAHHTSSAASRRAETEHAVRHGAMAPMKTTAPSAPALASTRFKGTDRAAGKPTEAAHHASSVASRLAKTDKSAAHQDPSPPRGSISSSAVEEEEPGGSSAPMKTMAPSVPALASVGEMARSSVASRQEKDKSAAHRTSAVEEEEKGGGGADAALAHSKVVPIP